jgi:hypothetical protein
MFPKTYLEEKGVAPVMHLSPAEEERLPTSLKHRVVSFSKSSNWIHEREWRAGADLEFDPSYATVLVPRFAQIQPFQRVLERKGIRVNGYLPLLDLFACI